MATILRHPRLTTLTAVLTLLLAVGQGRGQLASKKESLAGHRSVFVAISVPESDPAVRDLGVRRDSLQRFVVDRLNEKGISVSTEYTDETLILDIHVDLVKVVRADGQDVYAFVSQFEAIQAARLATNRLAALVTTWRATKFGAVTRDNPAGLRDSVRQNVDAFVEDWVAAQPPASNYP